MHKLECKEKVGGKYVIRKILKSIDDMEEARVMDVDKAMQKIKGKSNL